MVDGSGNCKRGSAINVFGDYLGWRDDSPMVENK